MREQGQTKTLFFNLCISLHGLHAKTTPLPPTLSNPSPLTPGISAKILVRNGSCQSCPPWKELAHSIEAGPQE